MEGIKENSQNKINIIVDPYTSVQDIVNKLIFSQNINEFKFIIKKCRNANTHLELIVNAFRQLQNVDSLSFHLENIFLLNLELIFKEIVMLPQLKILSIKLANDIYISQNCNYTFGECLLNLKNLEDLQLIINCSNIPQYTNFLRFYEAYESSLMNLTKFQIDFQYIDKQSPSLELIFEGLRHLQKLKTLSINIESSDIRGSKLFDCLEELLYLKQLNDLSIFLGWNSKVSTIDIEKLGNTLSHLTQLERLSLRTQYRNLKQSPLQNDIDNYTGLEKPIKSFCNLKYLCLKIIGSNTGNLLNLLVEISQIQTLDEVIIDIYVNLPNQYDSNVKLFGQYLSKIQKISDLDIYFSYSCKIQSQELIEFICSLKPLKHLKKLSIYSSSQEQNQDLSQININDCIEVFQNLEKLKLTFTERATLSNQCILNFFLESVKGLSNIQYIQFQNQSYVENLDCQKEIQPIELINSHQNFNYLFLQFSNKYKLTSSSLSQTFLNLKQLANIKNLYLQFDGNQIFDEGTFISLSSALECLKKITCLSLQFGQNNVFQQNVFMSLCQNLRTLSNIEILTLRFQNKDFNIESIINIVSILKDLETLQVLTLHVLCDLDINKHEAQQLGKVFILPNKLRSVQIQINIGWFDFEDIEDLFKSISKQKDMFNLDIKFSKLRVNRLGCERLRQYLSELKKIEHFKLQFFQMNLLYLIHLLSDIPFLERLTFDREYRNHELYKVYLRKKIQYTNQEQNTKYARYFLHEQLIKNSQKPIGNQHNYQYFEDNRTEKIKLKLQNAGVSIQDNIDNSEWIFEGLRVVTHLNIIMLDIENFSSRYLNNLVNNLKYLVNLQQLYLNFKKNQNFNTECVISLGNVLPYFQLLNKLALKIYCFDNSIDWQQAYQFTNNISHLKQLEYFKIKLNNSSTFGFIGFQMLCNSLSQLNKLKYLAIIIDSEMNTVSVSQELRSLFTQINQNLIHLNIRLTTLRLDTLENQRLFSKIIRILKNIQTLKISPNQISLNQLRKVKKLVSIIEKIE